MSGVILLCSVQRNAVKMGEQGNEAGEVCACNTGLGMAREK